MILTRYLYNYFQVNCSLFLALLDRNKDEALFWCYELYYSGFDEETFKYLISLYDTLYITRKNIKEKIQERYTYWKECETEENHIIGEIVCNLINYKYSICKMMKKFKKSMKCKEIKVDVKYPNSYTMLSDTEINTMIGTYSTKRNDAYYWKTMKGVCKYKIRNNINQLCQEPVKYNTTEWSNNWLLYVLETPLWQERIKKFNGNYDIERKKIHFKTSDDEEEFHNHYNLEPDEQSLDIQTNCLGCEEDFQYTYETLIENYGGIIE